MTVGTDNGETLFGTDSTDVIDGKGGNDLIFGKDGADLLLGGAGDDVLVGGAGANILNGGDGIDTASYSSWSAGVTVILDASVSPFTPADAVKDTFIDVENITGSPFKDLLMGDNNANVLHGMKGDDGLYGLGGEDKLYGDDGRDTLTGGTGGDLLDGGSGIDTASYAWSMSGVVINLLQHEASGGDAEGDTLLNIENIDGSSHGDTLTGDGAGNWLRGGDGNDKLLGSDGDDLLDGGAGADKINGGDGHDTLHYAALAGVGIKIDLKTGTGHGGEAEGDQISSVEGIVATEAADTLSGDDFDNGLTGAGGDDVLNGRGGSDSLMGYDGNDTVNGGAGNDYIYGIAGRDKLTGGGGKDEFAFYDGDSGATAATRDVITDFVEGVDKIRLQYMDANANLGGNQDFIYISGHGFQGVAGQLRFFTEGGNTILEGDLNGDKIGDFQIQVNGIVTFTSGTNPFGDGVDLVL